MVIFWFSVDVDLSGMVPEFFFVSGYCVGWTANTYDDSDNDDSDNESIRITRYDFF